MGERRVEAEEREEGQRGRMERGKDKGYTFEIPATTSGLFIGKENILSGTGV